MTWRIGLLQDAAAVERQAAKEAAQDAAKHKKATTPTVKTEAQAKADEEAAAKATKSKSEPEKPRSKPRIRPLSEAKAVETGATFISETFLFAVAASLILFESWRSRRKETSRREDVAGRLNDLEESESAARQALIELEREVLDLRAKGTKGKAQPLKRILPKEVYEANDKDSIEPDEVSRSWLSTIAAYITTRDGNNDIAEATPTSQSPGPAEKILVDSDGALEEKRKQQGAEEAPKAGTAKS